MKVTILLLMAMTIALVSFVGQVAAAEPIGNERLKRTANVQVLSDAEMGQIQGAGIWSWGLKKALKKLTPKELFKKFHNKTLSGQLEKRGYRVPMGIWWLAARPAH